MTGIIDNPFCAYQITSSSTSYVDITGGGNTATSSPALPVSNSFITSHNTSPAVIGGTAKMVIPYNRFSPGWEGSVFSLECWFDSLTTGSMGIMSHLGATDGLYFDGDNISFGVDMYADPSHTIVDNIRASWAIPDFKSANHLVGIYDTGKVYLYVDGILQAESDVPNDKINNGFVTLADTKLYCGESAAGQSALFDLPTIYSYTLSGRKIASHFSLGRSAVKSSDIATNRGASLWTLLDRDRNFMLNNNILFEDGLLIDTVIRDGLRPAFDESLLSIANCTWQYSVSVGEGFTGPTAGMKLSWNGDGIFIVETSINNGVSWSSISNGCLATGSIGLDASSAMVIRITFAGGVLGDISTVRNISAVVYSNSVVRGTDQSRALTLNGNVTTSDQDTEPMKRYENSGARLSDGYITLGPDLETDPNTISTIEMFVSFDSVSYPQQLLDLRNGQTGYIWLNGSSVLAFSGLSALYVNGTAYVSGAFHPAARQEYHIVAIPITALATTGPAVIGNDYYYGTPMAGRVSLLATYPTVLSGTDVSAIYNSYNGVPRVSISDSGSVGVHETAIPTRIYSSVWSIGSGG